MAHKKAETDYRILISYSEYESLLKQSEELKKHHAKIALQLQTEAEPKNSEISAIPESKKIENNEVEQSGSGLRHELNHEQLIKEITAKVVAEVSKVFSQNKPSTEQTGLGANDLIPEPPATTSDSTNLYVNFDNPTSRPIKSDFVVQKSKLNTIYEDQVLVDLLPEKLKARGRKLLTSLLPFASSLSWNKNGTIFINQTGLPESSIFLLFPKLFKNTKDINKIPNLLELVNAIASLGFGHLINRKLTLGLNRRFKIGNQDSLHSDIQNNKHWWFLGQ